MMLPRRLNGHERSVDDRIRKISNGCYISYHLMDKIIETVPSSNLGLLNSIDRLGLWDDKLVFFRVILGMPDLISFTQILTDLDKSGKFSDENFSGCVTDGDVKRLIIEKGFEDIIKMKDEPPSFYIPEFIPGGKDAEANATVIFHRTLPVMWSTKVSPPDIERMLNDELIQTLLERKALFGYIDRGSKLDNVSDVVSSIPILPHGNIVEFKKERDGWYADIAFPEPWYIASTEIPDVVIHPMMIGIPNHPETFRTIWFKLMPRDLLIKENIYGGV